MALFQATLPTLYLAEANARAGRADLALNQLRRLSLDDFGLFTLSLPSKQFPELSALLPRMATEEAQKLWAGASGETLLRQTLTFIRILNYQAYEVTGAGLKNRRILDYGCGFGRLLRIMPYYTDLENLAGCDPWDQAINLCRDDGLKCRLDLTDFLPEKLPYEPHSFDVVYSLSVFTHTSMRATVAALKALHPVLKPGGLLAATIRPVEYWTMRTDIPVEEAKTLRDLHESKGFAFKPHNRTPIDGDITYGDTSMKMETIASICPMWELVGYDRSLEDPYQIIVLLKPKQA